MKQNYPNNILTILIFCLLSASPAFAQLYPIMNPIQGPSAVCSQPASPKTFSVTASNTPSSYAWSVIGPSASGVIISNPSGAVTTISFPYPSLYATYTVYCTASNNGGTSPNAATKVVTIYETPTVTFSGANVFCQGSSTNLSASPTILSASSTLFYNWSPSNGLSSTNGYSVTANPSSTTNYTVLLTMGTCTNTALITVQSIPCVGINSIDPENKTSLTMYPNPNSGSFFITSSTDELALILNEIGQTLQQVQLLEDRETKITGLPPGIYFIVTPNSRKKIIVTEN